MSTTEHLQKIKAKCEQLLAMAEKRTPGNWGLWGMSVLASTQGSNEVSKCTPVCNTLFRDENSRPRTFDANFIAFCAGSAEAGWRATIAAIDGLEEMDEYSHIHGFIAQNIIAAWSESLL